MSDDPVERLIEDFLARRMEDSHATLADLLAEHPEHADVLQRRLAHLEGLDVLRPVGSAPKFDVPKSFDGFEIVRELGRGGMGIVYEARQVALGRRVAIKVIAGGGALSARLRDRFEREITTLARISHPNIVKVFGSGTVAGAPYVTMELVEGTPLARRIPDAGERPSRANVRELVQIGAKLARALDNAHELGVVHRDVKPGNVLIDSRGEPVLIDFGLARDVERDSMTVTGEFVGTLMYTAPEQARGEHVDRRADVYGLAASLFHLLTGSPPYTARSITDLVRQFESGPPSSISRLNPALQRDVATVLDHALSPKPQDRYASCADFADDFEATLEGRPIRARRVGVTGRLTRWIRRRPATATALAAAALAAITSGMLVEATAKERQRVDRTEHAQRVDRARTAVTGQRLSAAEELLSEICHLWPDDLDAWEMRVEVALAPRGGGRWAHVRIDAEQPAKARRVLESAPTILVEEPSGVLLARTITALENGIDVLSMDWRTGDLPVPSSPEQSIRLARVYSRVLQRGDDALSILRSVVAAKPTEFGALVLLAQMLRDSGTLESYSSAVAAYTLRPDDAAPAAQLALCTLGMRRDKSTGHFAIEPAEEERVWRLFDHALEVDPRNPAILQQYAFAVGELRPDDWAGWSEALLRDALDVDPNFAIARFSLSWVLAQPQRTDPREMLALIEPIEREYGYGFGHWRDRAYYCDKVYGPQAAVEVLQRGLEQVDPDQAFHVLSLITSYRGDFIKAPGNLAAAIEEWDQLFQCVPDDGDGMQALLEALATIRDVPRRDKWIQRCLELRARGVVLSEETESKLKIWGAVK